MSYFVKTVIFIFLVSVALTPLHTKIAGIAWVSFTLVLLALLFQQKGLDKEQFNRSTLTKSISLWLILAIVTYLLRLGVQVYHGEFNQASNFNLRVLAIALFVYLALPKLNVEYIEKYKLDYLPLALLGIGFSSLFMALPLGDAFSFGTNQIPWAAGITLLASVLIVCMLQRINHLSYQILGWINLICLVVAIFSFGVRGSYFFILWLPCFALSYLFFLADSKTIVKTGLFGSLFLIISLVGFYFLLPEIYEKGLARIDKAYIEIIGFIHSPEQGASTSVGARLYMWVNALKLIPENPMLGFGKAGTADMIAQFAEVSKSETIVGLNQLHNEYLQALVSYGVFGLISFLLYPLGLLFIAFKLRKQHPQAFVGLLGMVFLFLTASLTNTNSYHNYFGTLFSLSVGLVFVVCRLQEIQQAKSN